jgi:hypothetical protein
MSQDEILFYIIFLSAKHIARIDGKKFMFDAFLSLLR